MMVMMERRDSEEEERVETFRKRREHMESETETDLMVERWEV